MKHFAAANLAQAVASLKAALKETTLDSALADCISYVLYTGLCDRNL